MDIDEPESEDQEQDEDQEVEIDSADEPTPDVQDAAESSRAPSPSESSLPKQPARKVRLKLGNPKARIIASTLNSSAASATPEPDIIPGRRTGKRAIGKTFASLTSTLGIELTYFNSSIRRRG